MGTIPVTKVGKIEFCESHVEAWTTNAVAIGTSSPAVTSWSTQTTAARAAYQAQQLAQSAAKDATNNLNLAVRALSTSTSAIVKQVRAKADMAGDGVYSLASLPPPVTPVPMPAPGQPYGFTVALNALGALTLKWKCNNPSGSQGTVYQIWRKIGPPSTEALVYIGGSGKKEFTDATLPAGSMAVTYQIQAARSTAVGPWATFKVHFGVSGGSMTASVEMVMRKAA